MNHIPPHFQIAAHPLPNEKSVVQTPCARFTLLTSRLIRLEYHPDGLFEDRPSQIFWHRSQPVPPYDVLPSSANAAGLEIKTEHLHVRYLGGPFTSESLSIEVKTCNSLSRAVTWHYGNQADTSPVTGNLLGTARTLDGVYGQTKLEQGLMSRQGWAVVDDSKGLVFNTDGWLVARPESSESSIDLYFFGYGHNYADCLTDFYKVSGPAPIIPRWALGNWWSRYWAYNQQELGDLMLDFMAHDIPLSVCIIDMDWHLEGWTGYTWNNQLFPDPQGFLRFLHELGLKTSLNLHSADGIGAHEKAYPQMAQALGIDPTSLQRIKFNLEDPTFAKAYFEILHHPKEAQGIDFWWMDWQQGNPSHLPGLNLLWWINHMHFLDLGRAKIQRPFVFSRWGGLGNQRYPIGFSGDSVVAWESLAFQPYFTATAANVGYGWWSHDIGGHMGGIEDAELFTRWVQFGVFSPIFRLHSTKNTYHERRPWGYDAETLRITRNAMQLRHALIPYLYSMAWRDHQYSTPLVRPMYHLYPEHEEAYACPNQYAFGSELIVAPFITPRQADTRLSRQVVWLHNGDWYGLFDERFYPGGWHAVYGGLDDMPVFAKAGAIIPLAPLTGWGGIDNPKALTLHIFPGTHNRFELYEDDGISEGYRNNDYVLTAFTLESTEDSHILRIEPAQGMVNLVPTERGYSIIFHALNAPSSVEVAHNGSPIATPFVYDAGHHTLTFTELSLSPEDSLMFHVQAQIEKDDSPAPVVDYMLRCFQANSDVKLSLLQRIPELLFEPSKTLADYLPALTKVQLRSLIETIARCGIEVLTNAGESQIVLWNTHKDPQAAYTLAIDQQGVHGSQRFRSETDVIPSFKIIHPALDFQSHRKGRKNPALLQVRYGEIIQQAFEINQESQVKER